MASFLGITADEDYGGLAMGYQAHCIVMEEISKASGSLAAAPALGTTVSDLLRQYRVILRRTLPTLYKPIMSQRKQGSEREISPRFDIREEDRSVSHVGTFGRVRRREHENYSESRRRWIPAQWH